MAVKTVNPSADVAYFKTLLSELKVMTFVSHHENVVGLIGACTANIKESNFFSQKHLITNKSALKDTMPLELFSILKQVTTKALFCRETVCSSGILPVWKPS